MRPYGIEDKEYFIELLPQDASTAEGSLPSEISDWITAICETGADSFCVGYIWGPSGSGKTSLLNAGIMPNLPPGIIVVPIDADDTISLEKLIPAKVKLRFDTQVNPDALDPPCALSQYESATTLVVIDQFEQWLKRQQSPRPVGAVVDLLLAADGANLKVLVVVRSEFKHHIDSLLERLCLSKKCVRSQQHFNFQISQAERVLFLFGQHYGGISEVPTEENQQFLEMAAKDLSRDGWVSPVRLGVLVEMLKHQKQWTKEELTALGGTDGMILKILKETFESERADAKASRLREHAKLILAAFLSGGEIKGGLKRRKDLAEICGLPGVENSATLNHLLKILDDDLHLISVAEDPDYASIVSANTGPSSTKCIPWWRALLVRLGTRLKSYHKRKDRREVNVADNGECERQFYKLTHDDLLRPLSAWIDNPTTWTGRARARLRRRCYQAPDAVDKDPSTLRFRDWLKSVPAYFEWKLVAKREKKVLGRSSVYYAMWSCILALAFLVIAMRTRTTLRASRVQAALSELRSTTALGAQEAAAHVDELMPEIRDTIEAELETGELSVGEELRYRLVLNDKSSTSRVSEMLLVSSFSDLSVASALLKPKQPELFQNLWNKLQEPNATASLKLKCASVLSEHYVEDERWKLLSPSLAQALVEANVVDLVHLVPRLRPIRNVLIPELRRFYLQRDSDSYATNSRILLTSYARGNPMEPSDSGDLKQFTDLFLDADERHVATFLPLSEKCRIYLQIHQDPKAERLYSEVLLKNGGLPYRRVLVGNGNEDAFRKQALDSLLERRLSNAALAMYASGDPTCFDAIAKEPARVGARSYLIDTFGLFLDPATLVTQIQEGSEDPMELSLWILCVANSIQKINTDARLLYKKWLEEKGVCHTHPFVKSASEWSLRSVLNDLRQTQQLMSNLDVRAKPSYFVNESGKTMIIFDGSISFQMGTDPTSLTPDAVDGFECRESAHSRRIERTFAMSSTEVTRAEYQEFLDDFANYLHAVCCVPKEEAEAAAKKQRLEAPIRILHSPDVKCPANNVSWNMAAMYCDWLTVRHFDKESCCYNGAYLKAPNAEVGEAAVLINDEHLSKTGYRLPTEAEWEFAARAGASNSRFFGDDLSLISKYACVPLNSAGETSFQVGSMMPNQFGLFDMLGNVLEWTSSEFRTYEEEFRIASKQANVPSNFELNDSNIEWSLAPSTRLVARGGSFYNPISRVRSAYRYKYSPLISTENIGFRIVRTILPSIDVAE